jgi:AcrR family transcriptional regulator
VLTSIKTMALSATRMSPDDRREQVLGVAEVMFARHGYHHVSMDDIADSAAVSKPVLYRHFPSKLALYLGVIDRQGEVLLATIEDSVAAAPPGSDGQTVARALVSGFVRFADETGPAASLLFRSDVTRDETVHSRVEYALSESTAVVQRALLDSADLEPAEVELLAQVLMTMAQSAATSAQRTTVNDPADLVARLLWLGLHDFVRDPA